MKKTYACILGCILLYACSKNLNTKVVIPEKPGSSASLQAQANCEPDLEMELYWERKIGVTQRLDVTVFKNGFNEQLFSTLFPLDEKSTFSMLPQVKKQGNKIVESLTGIQIKRLEIVNSNSQTKQQNLTLTLTKLEGGFNYFFRVLTYEKGAWHSSNVLRVDAPSCPNDRFIDEK